MDGCYFVEEFICCKKFVEKGIIIDKQFLFGVEGKVVIFVGGGWSEVVKKGGFSSIVIVVFIKEVDQGLQGIGFKVVFSCKKGKRQVFFFEGIGDVVIVVGVIFVVDFKVVELSKVLMNGQLYMVLIEGMRYSVLMR